MGNVYMEADQIRYKGQYRTVQEALDNGGGGGGTTVVANPEGSATADLAKLQVGTTIYGIPAEAGDISYDNTSSGMTADDVQEAIDELSAAMPGVATTSAPGIVQPDGTTITIVDGVISAVGGSGNVTVAELANIDLTTGWVQSSSGVYYKSIANAIPEGKKLISAVLYFWEYLTGTNYDFQFSQSASAPTSFVILAPTNSFSSGAVASVRIAYV